MYLPAGNKQSSNFLLVSSLDFIIIQKLNKIKFLSFTSVKGSIVLVLVTEFMFSHEMFFEI